MLADVLDSHFASKHDVAEVNRSIQGLAAELAEVRADTLKWMAGLLLAQASLIVAAVKLL